MGNGGSKLEKVLKMGNNSSKQEKELKMGSHGSKPHDQFPDGERYFGLINFGNTCYCNSVLQALYFCLPFREKVLEYYEKNKSLVDAGGSDLLSTFAGLFVQIRSRKKKTREIALESFRNSLLSEYPYFRGGNQQDAHEFLNVLLNKLLELELQFSAEVLRDEELFVNKIFQGTVTEEKKCLKCGHIATDEETFLDLNVAIESDTSITYCLENHFSTIMLSGENAKDCNKCGRLQDAKKRTMMKKAPQILVLHLKRFERINRGSSQKLDYRVAYPFELKLTNTTEAADTEYSLSAVVVHLGNTLQSGHYVCIARSRNNWLYFDDEEVETIDGSFVQLCFGAEVNYTSASENGYLLFYERTSP